MGADRYDALIEQVRARWAPILDVLGEGITITTVDGKVVYANPAVAEQVGLSVEDFVAAEPGALVGRFDVRDEHGAPVDPDRMPGRVVLRGEAEQASLLVRNTVPQSGESRWFLMKARRLDGIEAELAANVVEDLTALKQVELAQRLLADSGRVLGTSLDSERTLREIAQLAVPELADWCGVDMPGPHGEIRPVAIAHADPDKVRLGRELRERYPVDPDGPAGLPAVLRGEASFLMTRVTDSDMAAYAEDDEHLRLLRAVGFRSVMVVPMVAHGVTLGALTFVSAESARGFGAADLELAEELGRRAGLAVANARAFTDRAQIARTLQASLRPPPLPELEGWDLAFVHRPAGEANDVGGDFFEVFSVRDGWMAAIGDVAGKGAGAAAITALARHTVHAVAQLTGSPLAAVRQLDWRLRGEPETALCSVLLAHVRGDVAEVVCAGHPAPVHVGPRGAVEVDTCGPLPGALPGGASWDRVAQPLAPGDALVLFTDGVPDTVGAGRERFGTQRVLELLDAPAASARELADRLDGALRAFEDGPQRDDVACLVLRRR